MSIDIGIKDAACKSMELPDTGGKKAVHGGIAAASEPERDLPPKELEAAASDIQIHLKRLNTELKFEIDGRSKEVVIKILEPETRQVIRQIPSEELMAIRDRMKDLIGVLYRAET